MENTLRKAIINQTVQNIMKNKINLLCVAFFSLLLAGCEKENNDFVGSDNYIISFKLVNGEQEWPAIIADNNITVTVPAGADLSGAAVVLETCEHVAVSPDPASITDWEASRDFTAVSYNQTQRTYHYSLVRTEADTKGDFVLNTQASVDAFATMGIETIDGNLSVGTETSEDDPITNLDGLQSLKNVRYILTIGEYCTLPEIKLENLQRTGALRLSSLADEVQSLSLPALEAVSMNAEICSGELTSLDLAGLSRVDGDFILKADKMEEISLSALVSIGGELQIQQLNNNQAQVQKISLGALQTIGKRLYLYSLRQLVELDVPALKIVGGIYLEDCREFTELSCPTLEETTSYSIDFKRCSQLTSYKFPTLKKAWSIICNSSLTSLDFSSLTTVTSDLTLTSMTLSDLGVFGKLETVGGILSLDGVKELTFSFDKLGTLKNIGGLGLNNIPVDEGELDFTQSGITGDITLSGSSMLIDKIIGPDRFEGTLNLNNSSATKLPVIEGFRVMGGLTINANPSDAVSLPVEEILGDLTLTKMGGCPSFEMPNLKRVGGEFEAVITTLTKATSFTLPALETIGGNMTFATGRPGTPQSIGMPALTAVGGNLFVGPTSTIALLKPNTAITSLDFGKLTSVNSVTVDNLKSLKDFSGFTALVPYIDATRWNVTECAYNPKYSDLKNGDFTEP